jgi:hypothetical protein
MSLLNFWITFWNHGSISKGLVQSRWHHSHWSLPNGRKTPRGLASRRSRTEHSRSSPRRDNMAPATCTEKSRHGSSTGEASQALKDSLASQFSWVDEPRVQQETIPENEQENREWLRKTPDSDLWSPPHKHAWSYVHTHPHPHTCTHTCTHTHTHHTQNTVTLTYIRTYTVTFTSTHTHTHRHTHNTHSHTYNMYKYTQTHIYTHTHRHLHTYTHTHTPFTYHTVILTYTLTHNTHSYTYNTHTWIISILELSGKE